MDTIGAGVQFVAEGKWLERRTVLKVKWQDVHYRKHGNNSYPCYYQSGNKPRFFHECSPEMEIDALSQASMLFMITSSYWLSNRQGVSESKWRDVLSGRSQIMCYICRNSDTHNSSG